MNFVKARRPGLVVEVSHVPDTPILRTADARHLKVFCSFFPVFHFVGEGRVKTGVIVLWCDPALISFPCRSF